MSLTDKDTDYLKKAALISKWIDQYAHYISFEEKFIPKKTSITKGVILYLSILVLALEVNLAETTMP